MLVAGSSSHALTHGHRIEGKWKHVIRSTENAVWRTSTSVWLSLCSDLEGGEFTENVRNASTGSNGGRGQTRSECDYNHMKVCRHASRYLPPTSEQPLILPTGRDAASLRKPTNSTATAFLLVRGQYQGQ